MKSHGMAVVLVLAMVVTSLAVEVSQIEGRWVSEDASLEFLPPSLSTPAESELRRTRGDGIGRDRDAYFTYTLADDQLTLDYGAGETAEYTVFFNDARLHLVEDEDDDEYEHEPLGLSPCVINLHKLNAAKELFAKDHGDRMPSLSDLMVYLPNLPQCPDGGIYTINAPGTPPRCSVPGHALDD